MSLFSVNVNKSAVSFPVICLYLVKKLFAKNFLLRCSLLCTCEMSLFPQILLTRKFTQTSRITQTAKA